MSQESIKTPRRRALIAGLVIAVLALAGSTVYLEVRGPSTSYVDGYNFAVAFTHALRQRPLHYSRVDAFSSCSVWSFSNAGGVPPRDVPRQWRQGCEKALTTGAYSTIGHG